jgi:glucokinase
MVAGVDVGGTKIAFGLVDPMGVVSDWGREEVDRSSATSAAEQVIRILRSFAPAGLEAAGVAIPGIANAKDGTVWAPNVRGWDRIPLQRRLEEAVQFPVCLESDRNCSVLGEYYFGEGQGVSDQLFLIVGTGIGVGVLSGGRLVRGAGEVAGAVGWSPALWEGELRRVEDVLAGPALERLARERGLPGVLPELAVAADNGDPEALQLFGQAGRAAGQLLAHLVNCLNPQLIVVGGGVSRCWKLLAPTAIKAFAKWGQPLSAPQTSIVVSRLGDRAGVLGAAAAARHRLEGSV